MSGDTTTHSRLTAHQQEILTESALLECQGETVITRRLSIALSLGRQNIRIHLSTLRALGYVQYQGCLVGHIGTGRSRQTHLTTP